MIGEITMPLDRRQFLVAALAAPLLQGRRTEPAPLIDRGFGRVVPTADGVWVTIADPSKGPQCLSNGGVIAGRDQTLIVEGHFQAAGAALEIEAAHRVSARPIHGAVNTHFHLDHTFGNIGYQREGVTAIAHEQVPRLMKAQYAALKGADKSLIYAPLQRKVSEATTPAEEQQAQAELGAARWMYGSIDAVELVYPTDLVRAAEGTRRLDLGGLVVVLEGHHGHTPGDLTIAVPDRGVVFMGDLLFVREYPVSVDADMVRWQAVLDRFLQLDRSTRFVPGHGPVCDRQALVDMAALLDDLRQHAERMIAKGVDAGEASARYTPPARFSQYQVWVRSWTIGAALKSYYAGLSQRHDRVSDGRSG